MEEFSSCHSMPLTDSLPLTNNINKIWANVCHLIRSHHYTSHSCAPTTRRRRRRSVTISLEHTQLAFWFHLIEFQWRETRDDDWWRFCHGKNRTIFNQLMQKSEEMCVFERARWIFVGKCGWSKNRQSFGKIKTHEIIQCIPQSTE